MTGLIVLFVVLGIGMLFVIHGTLAKHRWGINLAQVTCPRCGIAVPSIRKPASLSQTLWGGVNCPACACALDKWGREIGKA